MFGWEAAAVAATIQVYYGWADPRLDTVESMPACVCEYCLSSHYQSQCPNCGAPTKESAMWPFKSKAQKEAEAQARRNKASREWDAYVRARQQRSESQASSQPDYMQPMGLTNPLNPLSPLSPLWIGNSEPAHASPVESHHIASQDTSTTSSPSSDYSSSSSYDSGSSSSFDSGSSSSF